MVIDAALLPLLDDPRRTGFLVDFDGSLAPIVDDPARAVPLRPATEALDRLARRLGLVGVVSGRPVAFLRAHLPDPRVVVVGHYGLEVEHGHGIEVDARAQAFAPAVEAAALDAARRWPALTVERKGGVAVTVHWRRAPGHAPSPADLDALAAAHGLAGLPGRMAYELRPPVSVDKGTAVTALLAATDLTAAAFAGDDLGDLEAFAALATWAADRAGRAAVRVAVASPEAPRHLLDAADVVVLGPEALAAQLGALADAIG